MEKSRASKLVLMEAILYNGKDKCDRLSNQLFETVSNFKRQTNQ